ncbi:hypothetical protein A1O1_06579 [Capronia coronata CBS 617.96]|uniref:Uncharacterized protein n=1 Tax=Capronia coronata CBS 617.96 TaxID=1182541 RepID=W9YVA2_9EURO|nr:uncharacterized protein A1O1_06579 [Capronia coronata CBS 617.96]EXJ86209.1 hypothetical protein A1O1_06579 [Capronia coronata CBS 617.96]
MSPSLPFNVSAELAALKHEKKNHDLHRLPPSTTIRRRPLDHPSVPDIRAGAKIPKVVYVSRRTPVVAAVKRVKKMLGLIEKRALQDAGATIRSKHKSANIAEANERIAESREEVLVKASGRAMEQALRVGEWFRNKEKEVLCNVEVRTGSVSVIDDIVELDQEDEDVEEQPVEEVQEVSKNECGDTTLELLGDVTTVTMEQMSSSNAGQQLTGADLGTEDPPVKQTRRKRKRKRPVYKDDDLPEARLRWIKTVEVAISLQG